MVESPVSGNSVSSAEVAAIMMNNGSVANVVSDEEAGKCSTVPPFEFSKQFAYILVPFFQ